MAKKKGKKLIAPKYLVLAVLLTILVIAVTFLGSKKQGNVEVTQTPSTLTEEKVEEEVKDGVYTNYTYGFRFEYPEEIFNYTNPWTNHPNNNPSYKVFFVEGQRFPQLSINLLSEDLYGELYSKCVSSNVGATIDISEKTGSISVKRYDLNNICVSEVTPYGEGLVESGWSHIAIVPIEDIKK